MDKRGPSTAYGVDIATTALISIDFQIGFGDSEWEHVPDARSALDNFKSAAASWRAAGGRVFHVYTAFDRNLSPGERVTDFFPDIAEALDAESDATKFYDGLVEPSDFTIRKTNFSATVSSDILSQLRCRGITTAVVGGLTTPICVQTSVDGLSMAGIKTILLEDACASQGMGGLSPQEAHQAAVGRMGYFCSDVMRSDQFIALAAQLH